MSNKNKWKKKGYYDKFIKENNKNVDKNVVVIKDKPTVTTKEQVTYVDRTYDVNEKITFHIIFKGQVQGVSFRDTIETQSKKYGLFGSVENLKDETVECYLYGTRRDIARVVEYMLAGNGLQKVEEITTFKNVPGKKFTNFTDIRPKPVWSGYSGWGQNDGTGSCSYGQQGILGWLGFRDKLKQQPKDEEDWTKYDKLYAAMNKEDQAKTDKDIEQEEREAQRHYMYDF